MDSMDCVESLESFYGLLGFLKYLWILWIASASPRNDGMEILSLRDLMKSSRGNP